MPRGSSGVQQAFPFLLFASSDSLRTVSELKPTRRVPHQLTPEKPAHTWQGTRKPSVLCTVWEISPPVEPPPSDTEKLRCAALRCAALVRIPACAASRAREVAMESSQYVAHDQGAQTYREGDDQREGDTLAEPKFNSAAAAGDARSTFTDTVVDEVRKDGSEAQLSDGSVQKKPPGGGLLQSIGCTISEAVSSAKDVTVGYWNKDGPPQSTGSTITGRDATRAEDVLELDAHHKDKLQEHLNSPDEAMKALASAGAAVASSVAAAKDAVVRAFSSSTSN